MSVILRVTNDSGVVQDIQIQEQIDLRLDISAIENTSIGDVYGISSQEFSIPGTNEVNQFFGNLYNLGATPSIALQNSIDCQVLFNGAEVFKGKLYIKNIITDSDGYDTLYNVIVTNEIVDFKFEIQNVYVNQLDFSSLDHSLTYANVSQSWGGGLKNGSIIYPFVNYGKPEGDSGAPDYAFASFNSSGSNTIDNYTTPLRLFDFKPSIRAKDIVNTIFSGSSYDYTSSFFNSSYFENLYVLPTANEQIGPNNTSPVSQSVWVYNQSGSQNIPAGNQATIEWDAEIIDNSNNFNLSTERYTADTAGTYQYQVNIAYLTSTWTTYDNANTVKVILRKNGSSIVDSQFYYSIPATGSAFLEGGVSLVAGDYLNVEIVTGAKAITVRNDIGQPSYYPAGSLTYWKLKGPSTLLGGNVVIADQFPDDLKALDFLQGLIEKFNLVVETVPNSRNLIKIEPYQDWINAGVSKDWTDKVDRSEKFEITHPIVEQPRTIIFSDEEDEDVLNEYTLNTQGKIYGSYTFTSDSDLAQGERRIGKVFGATPVTGIPNGRKFIIPHLCTLEDNSNFKPFKFKPRLLYNNGLQTVPDTALGIQTGSISRGNIFIRDENSTVKTVSIWNQMSTLTAVPVNYESGQDLHFNNDQYSPYFQATANGKVKADAYRTYWATYINNLYDYDARKLTCNVYLKPTEIQDIALNDKLFIDGAYYRINKINGANLTRRDTVEVELIKILTAQFKFPKRRIFTGPTDFISVVADYSQLTIAGTGRYINVDTGDVVNDYTQLRTVASKDNFQIYNYSNTGSIVWDFQQSVDTTNQFDQKIIGTNKIGIGASKVSATGNNNEVKQGSETSLVVGANNTIGENTSNTTVLGQGHSVSSLVSNAQILGGLNSTISGSNNSIIVGGTGSLLVNNDWVVDINGYNDAVRDSDNTTVINSHNNEVIINGSGHTVIGLNYEGAGLDLLTTRNNSNWLGDTYMGEAQFINSYTLNVGDAANIYLTGSSAGQGKHESLYIVNWNGLSPGTASINLPSATNNDYKDVVYTFKLASGAGGEIVKLIPFTGSQTIDGASTYSTSGSYAWVSVHASGSKWHVINSSTICCGGSGSSSPAFPFTGSAQITGSLSVTGSVRGNVTTMAISNSTASMDLSKGNAFYLFLNTGSVLITGSNIIPNQHLSLFVSQSGGNNLYFNGDFWFSSSFTASQATGSKDILTFETYNVNPGAVLNSGITYNISQSQGSPPPSTSYPEATGGEIFLTGSYKIHKFTSSGDFTVTTTGSVPNNGFETLVVGGGGGGGSRAGGGAGAGGVIYMTSSITSFTNTTYRVTIGAGGAGAIDGSAGRGATGTDTTLTSSLASIFRAKGGGGGGGFPYASDGDGADGGSGGGGQSYSATVRGLGIQTSQPGDSGTYGTGSHGAPAFTSGGAGGGGGGASGIAPSGSPSVDSYINGSPGKLVTISGSFYVGGGGGGGDDCGNTFGVGGIGGGGNGGSCYVDGHPATANTGGGGGGGGGDFQNGGAGGSGIVIIKYRYQA